MPTLPAALKAPRTNWMNLRKPKSKNLPLHALPPRPLAVITQRAVQTGGGGIPKNAQDSLTRPPPVRT